VNGCGSFVSLLASNDDNYLNGITNRNPNSLAGSRSDTTTTTRLYQSSSPSGNPQSNPQKKNVSLPLLLIDMDRTTPSPPSNNEIHSSETKSVIPLPSSHLPLELSTLHLYGMQLEATVHKMMVQSILVDTNNAVDGGIGMMSMVSDDDDGEIEETSLYGHVSSTVDGSDSLVGAIGCVAQILISSPTTTTTTTTTATTTMMSDEDDDIKDIGDGDTDIEDGPITILVRGRFRFIVREVLQTFPFPIAIVDELLDDDVDETTNYSPSSSSSLENNTNEDDDDDYLNTYQNLPPTELLQRLLTTTKTLNDQTLTTTQPKPLSPLEQSLETSTTTSINPQSISQRTRAEETAALYAILNSDLVELAPTMKERQYAVAMMVAEMVEVESEVRKEILNLVDGMERMRVLLRVVEGNVQRGAAEQLVEDIVGKSDEESKDLQVGEPILPPWAKSISKGTTIEYYWNDEFEWCAGTVVDDPMMIVDELILTIQFDSDDEIHRLPFRADEKVRWRPGGMSSS